ncbi:MAG: redoxin domain-containing protein [Ardenticatenia bacterium]|nr:redoxin domain-containing protein [Ardenticatenia bacterium]
MIPAGSRSPRLTAFLCLAVTAALGVVSCRPRLVENATDLATLAPDALATDNALVYGTTPTAVAGDAERLGLGEPAPPFTLDNLAGEDLSLSDYAGRPVLLNFWATWCAPCVEEMPLLAGAAAQYDDQGLAVLLIDVGEEVGIVQAFAEERGLDLPVALDMNNETAYDYRVSAYPTSVLINAAGQVVDVRRGAFTDGAMLRQALTSILP